MLKTHTMAFSLSIIFINIIIMITRSYTVKVTLAYILVALQMRLPVN